MPKLNVFREINNSIEKVGSLETVNYDIIFTYSPEYLSSENAAALSPILPLQSGSFSTNVTAVFFEGLLPEGSMRKAVARAIHSETADFQALLNALNRETVGALLFSDGDIDTSMFEYAEIPSGKLAEFALRPYSVSFETNLKTHLSLAGMQPKIGLYHFGEDITSGWFEPKGFAPSTHIIKAPNAEYRLETINEALCLKTAKYCDFDVAECELIPIEGSEPLIAIERFDRVFTDIPSREINGLPVPQRLHQEDFCQCLGWPSKDKYEPTDGNYLNHGALLISENCSNSYGDKMMFFSRIIFDWLIGNCDNHLKNHSLLYSPNWDKRELSPLYDILCTTFYPGFSHEMGVSLCPSRILEDVSEEFIVEYAGTIGISKEMALEQLEDLVNVFPIALERACTELVSEGFTKAKEVACFIFNDAAQRCDKLSPSLYFGERCIEELVPSAMDAAKISGGREAVEKESVR